MVSAMSRSVFGNVRQLPSGRWQARYQTGSRRISAPATFATRGGAEGWLDQMYDQRQMPLHPGCPSCVCAYAAPGKREERRTSR